MYKIEVLLTIVGLLFSGLFTTENNLTF